MKKLIGFFCGTPYNPPLLANNVKDNVKAQTEKTPEEILVSMVRAAMLSKPENISHVSNYKPKDYQWKRFNKWSGTVGGNQFKVIITVMEYEYDGSEVLSALIEPIAVKGAKKFDVLGAKLLDTLNDTWKECQNIKNRQERAKREADRQKEATNLIEAVFTTPKRRTVRPECVTCGETDCHVNHKQPCDCDSGCPCCWIE